MRGIFQRILKGVGVGLIILASIGMAVAQRLPPGGEKALETEESPKYHFVMIEYEGGSWDPSIPDTQKEMYDHAKYFIPNFLRWLNVKHKKSSPNENAGPLWSEEVSLLRLSDKRIFDCHMLFIAGHFDFTFSGKERDNLKEFLEKGGFLYIENCGGLSEDTVTHKDHKTRGCFATRIKAELKALFPEGEFKVLPFDHDIYQMPNKFPRGLPNIYGENNKGGFDPLESPKKKRKDRGGEGFYKGKQMIAFYSDADTCCEWVLNGKGPWKDIPFQIGENIVTYPMIHY